MVELIKNATASLVGKKSYGVAAIICVTAGCFLLGIIDYNTAAGVIAGLLGISVATLRAGIYNAVKKVQTETLLPVGGAK